MIVLNSVKAQERDFMPELKSFVGKRDLQGASIGVCIQKMGGEVVLGYNPDLNLAPASSQKVLTASSYLDRFGAEDVMETHLSIFGTIESGAVNGHLVLETDGDPTFGSNYFLKEQTAGFILSSIAKALNEKKITHISGDLYIPLTAADQDYLPGSTAWADVGNYYGGQSYGFNYLDNQYSLYFNTPEAYDAETSIVKIAPELDDYQIINEVRTHNSKRDEAYIYHIPGTKEIVVRGHIPKGKTNFEVKGALPNPRVQFYQDLKSYLNARGIAWSGELKTTDPFFDKNIEKPTQANRIWTYRSPKSQELIRVMLKESQNLQANFMLKRLGEGSLSKGEQSVKMKWEQSGLYTDNLLMEDGSGLSLKNTCTARHLSQVLSILLSDQKATIEKGLKSKGNIRYKSGYVGGVRAYAGYITLLGEEHSFCVIVNRHNCSATQARLAIFEFLESLPG